MARDRPSPYGEGAAFFFVARGPVPRDGSSTVFFRSAGDRPPRALDCADDGEGQVFPPPYGEGGPSAAAAPIGAPRKHSRRDLLVSMERKTWKE